ncbi:MAG: hypothetical protein ACQESR_01610 [Planctomycetota bacterium]
MALPRRAGGLWFWLWFGVLKIGARGFCLFRVVRRPHGIRPARPCFMSVLYLGFVGTGQEFGDGVGDHDRAVKSLVSHDQADIAGGAVHAVPGEPDTVSGPHLRLAQVFRELFGGENELLFRRLSRGITLIRVKGIDDQCAIHFDRLRFLRAVEVNAAAKPAHGGLALLVHDRVGPETDDPFRRDRFLVGFVPRKRGHFDFGQLERRATG